MKSALKDKIKTYQEINFRSFRNNHVKILMLKLHLRIKPQFYFTLLFYSSVTDAGIGRYLGLKLASRFPFPGSKDDFRDGPQPGGLVGGTVELLLRKLDHLFEGRGL